MEKSEGFTVRPRRARAPKSEPIGRLVNLSRAAQLLDVAYDTVAKAVEEKDLSVEFSIEGANGRLMPVVRIEALDAYRHRAISRLRMFASPYHKARADALAERKVL